MLKIIIFQFLSIRHAALISKLLAIYLFLNLFAALQVHFARETNYRHSLSNISKLSDNPF